MLDPLRSDLQKLADKKKAKLLARYFKTGEGEYAEGDIFLGITVPAQRSIAKKYKDLNIEEIRVLLKSKIHEERLVGLLILVQQFKRADENEKAKIFNFYLSNVDGVNNWDLVDLSAPNIVGGYLIIKKKMRSILTKLGKSKNLWERRIAVVSTFAFMKEKEFEPSIRIAELLISDKNDLIHKAVGWMLREVGKADTNVLEEFLRRHYKVMPRTMLRYAIEKFDDKKRKFYLNRS